jgi:hypothetical protein
LADRSADAKTRLAAAKHLLTLRRNEWIVAQIFTDSGNA